ncbi:MAG: SprT-like domain-containing protein [Bacteroidales bacterium]|nr:SprT-like domain-containing protein [Bacteroidales bacterium]MDZ4203834.1 SprT-like domain-containing protein [Bacteroidales bacterium]
MHGIQILDKHLPAQCSGAFLQWLVDHSAVLTITRPRQCKLGDFRPANPHKPHRISVNSDLNPYAFAVTLVHEMAHLVVWQQHKRKAAPHGIEWKEAFRHLSQQLLFDRLPADINKALTDFFNTSHRSRATTENLTRMLRTHDHASGFIEVEKLPDGSIFSFHHGHTFRKIAKSRKRFRCQCISSKRYYLFSPLALVVPMQET